MDSNKETNTHSHSAAETAVPPPMSSLPRASVSLPPEGPPPMSPRARRTARRLGIALQALPLPAPGKRITERDVLSAARQDRSIPMTTAARVLASERGVNPADLARKLGRRLNSRDVAKLDPVPLRLPAERVRLFPREIERIARAMQAVRDVPQIALDAFLPVGELLRSTSQLGAAQAFLVHSIATLLTEERFKAFRALIDGDDLVYRGQINLNYIAHSVSAERSYLLQNVEKMSVETIRETLTGAPVPFDVLHGSVLVTVRDISQLPIDGFRAELEPGQAAVITLSALQARPVHDAERSEWVVKKGWQMYMAADARVIAPDLAGFFISRLKSRIEIPSILV